jgi:hypothetical protein
VEVVDEKCVTIENFEVDVSDAANELVDVAGVVDVANDKHLTIDATETLSELTANDIEIVMSSNGGRWYKTKLVNDERLYFRKAYNCNIGDNVVVVDVTKKPWVKQLGSLLHDNSVQFGDTIDVVRRHFVHIRCKHRITLLRGSRYCEKCKLIVTPANLSYLPYSSKDLLKIKYITVGEMLVNNASNKVVLIDTEYANRKENVLQSDLV